MPLLAELGEEPLSFRQYPIVFTGNPTAFWLLPNAFDSSCILQTVERRVERTFLEVDSPFRLLSYTVHYRVTIRALPGDNAQHN